MPGGMPPGSQSPGQQSPGGQTSGGQQMPGQTTGSAQMPGGQTPGQPTPGSQGEGNLPGQPSDPTWDPQTGGGLPGGEQQPSGSSDEGSWESGVPGGSGEDGWETSNQLPGGQASRVPPMPSEQGLPPGSGDGETGAQSGTDTAGGPGGQGGDGELDKALKDFDGGILAERAVIQARTNERAGTSNTPSELPGSGGATGDVETTGDPGSAQVEPAVYEPAGLPSQHTAQKGAPTNTTVPDDVPDARDDDIIARQLREAAMNETDPELREKLWEEYRRYKGA
jgi:hypothetical protein